MSQEMPCRKLTFVLLYYRDINSPQIRFFFSELLWVKCEKTKEHPCSKTLLCILLFLIKALGFTRREWLYRSSPCSVQEAADVWKLLFTLIPEIHTKQQEHSFTRVKTKSQRTLGKSTWKEQMLRKNPTRAQKRRRWSEYLLNWSLCVLYE